MMGHCFRLSLLPQVLERLDPKQHAVDVFPPMQLDGMREQRKHQGAHYQYTDAPAWLKLNYLKIMSHESTMVSPCLTTCHPVSILLSGHLVH